MPPFFLLLFIAVFKGAIVTVDIVTIEAMGTTWKVDLGRKLY